jgi:hypothetical protein
LTSLAEILRLDRALWAQAYGRQMNALELCGFDHAQLEAALIADEALALAETEPETARLILQATVELLLTMLPCQPMGALQVAIRHRLRGESQVGTGEPQNDVQLPPALARFLGTG